VFDNQNQRDAVAGGFVGLMFAAFVAIFAFLAWFFNRFPRTSVGLMIAGLFIAIGVTLHEKHEAREYAEARERVEKGFWKQQQELEVDEKATAFFRQHFTGNAFDFPNPRNDGYLEHKINRNGGVGASTNFKVTKPYVTPEDKKTRTESQTYCYILAYRSELWAAIQYSSTELCAKPLEEGEADEIFIVKDQTGSMVVKTKGGLVDEKRLKSIAVVLSLAQPAGRNNGSRWLVNPKDNTKLIPIYYNTSNARDIAPYIPLSAF
jgi:hypothetical protein